MSAIPIERSQSSDVSGACISALLAGFMTDTSRASIANRIEDSGAATR